MKSKSLFQLDSPGLARRSQLKLSSKASKMPLWLGASVALVSASLIAWTSGQIPGLPSPLRGGSFLSMGDKIYAAQLGGSTQDDARALYKKALTDLQDGNYGNALSEFKQLESVYPGLRDFLWLHQAEAYAGQGNEWAVQKKLGAVLSDCPDSVLKVLARYRIGQSQVRGSEWEKAQKTFEQIRRDTAESQYALGSLYYLGTVAAHQEGQQAHGVAHFREYLKQCVDCKFSGEAADWLDKLLKSPTPEDRALMGLAWAASGRDATKTIQQLWQGPVQDTWLALGKVLIQSGKKQESLPILTNGLPHAKDLDAFREAVDLLLAHSSTDKVELLKQLHAKNLPLGQDYLLWKLANVDSTQSQDFYREIANKYPQSDYAPESGWNLLWPLLAAGNDSAYISQAQQYLAKYPYARSAPKALFWIGKLYEKSASAQAKATYQNLMQQYPTTYYAFRAKGRLKVLAEGKQDPGWPTFASRRDYPIPNTDLNKLDILPVASTFGMGAHGQVLRDKAQELMRIAAADDVKLLVTEATGALPPAVQSWTEQVSGDRAKGLKTLREALEAQTKIAFLNAQGKPVQSVGTVDELKLLYPLYFQDLIGPSGHQNNVDPFLIQSLMREESYFNEFAISTSNARGLMQLLPSTAKDVAHWEGMPSFQASDLFMPATNVRLGSRYLAFLHQQFNGNSMPSVGAYNGGPGAMKRWIQNSTLLSSDPDLFVEKIPYEQSRDYIKKVFASYWNYTRLYATPAI